jgi:Pvc16 N-terminal domain
VIDALDKMIRRLLVDEVPQLTDILQVRFEAPDQDWLDYLSDQSTGGSPVLGVDCYLVELRENALLRSNEWVQNEQNGSVFREPAPMRVDLHYLVTAWDSVKISETLEPGIEEHKLLYAVLAVLAAATPLNASRIYPPSDPDFAAVPAPIKDFDLPTRLVPPEGYAKLAEFWTSMGQTVRWRPAAHLVVTLPVLLEHELVGEPVTTELVGYRQNGGPVTETLITVGVEALHAGAAVPGAWVRLETTGGRPVAEGRADSSGHVVFEDVAPGNYVLQARATGLGDPLPTHVEIPSVSGGYRVSFP